MQQLLAWFGVKGSVSPRAEPLLRANGVDPHRLYIIASRDTWLSK